MSIYNVGDTLRYSGTIPKAAYNNDHGRICRVTRVQRYGEHDVYTVRHLWGYIHDSFESLLSPMAAPNLQQFSVFEKVVWNKYNAIGTIMNARLIDGVWAYDFRYPDGRIGHTVYESELKKYTPPPVPAPTPAPLPSPTPDPAPITPIDEQPIPGEHTTAEEGKKRAQSKTIMIAAAAVAAFMLMR